MRIASLLVMTLSLTTPLTFPAHESSAMENVDSHVAQSTELKSSMDKLESELVAKYGESQRARLRRGMTQVGNFWRAEDGDAPAFEEFVRTNFAGEQATLDTMFSRLQSNLEQLDGHMGEIGREFRQQSDLDLGPILGFDDLFAAYDPAAHLNDDFFKNKLAFVVLLNFPLTTLEQKLSEGDKWSRRSGRKLVSPSVFPNACPRKLIWSWAVRMRKHPNTSRNTTFGCIT